MNKSVSLPRIRKNSQLSKALSIKQRNMDTDQPTEQGSLTSKNKHNQNNQSKKLSLKIKSNSLKNLRNQQKIRKSQQLMEGQMVKQRKFGLAQNGRLSKITQISTISKVLSTQRSKSSTLERQDKKHISQLKKQLNQTTSSGLILKKQIKAMQGRIAQLKQQINNFILQNKKQSNQSIQQKLQEVNIKTQAVKYDKEILKNMKDRLKKIIIYYEKKTIQQKQQLQKQQKRIKILGQRSAIRQQSINKKIHQFKKLQQTEKTANKLVEIQVEQYKKKMKLLNEQNQMNLKNSSFKPLNQTQYHYDVYKKQQKKLRQQYLTNLFIQNLLSIKWNKYSIAYQNEEKAQKLMEMHSIQKLQGQFDPRKVYFGSFQNKKLLEQKIRNKENILNSTLKQNLQLKKKWNQMMFKEIDQQEKIIDNTDMNIKSGKVEEKQVIQKQKRIFLAEMKKKEELAKQRAAKISRIKDWVFKIQKTIGLKSVKNTNLQDNLESIINYTRKQNKDFIKNNKR